MTRVDKQLVGKTITKVMARAGSAGGPAKIWMLAFDDGSFFEFVSPTAKRVMGTATQVHPEQPPAVNGDPQQLRLN